MIKYLCDTCEKEITPQERSSVYRFAKMVMKGKGMVTDAFEEMYCADCSDKILEKVEEMRKK